MSNTITLDDHEPEPDLRLQINLAIGQLRDLYPEATAVSVQPNFWLNQDGTLRLTWYLSAHNGTQDFPHSFFTSTLDEALAEMKQQRNRYADVETINAELSYASLEQASTYHWESV